jgi:hypothetical protein
MVPLAALEAWVKKLNLPPQHREMATSRIATEWEVVVLGAFAGVGSVEYEPRDHPEQQRTVDLRFCEDGQEEPLVAEITSISDATWDEQNPVSELMTLIGHRAYQLGLSGGLRLEATHVPFQDAREKKPRLLLPPLAELPQFVTRVIDPFLVSLTPDKPDLLPVRETSVSFDLHWDPAGEYMSGSFVRYATPYTVQNNPLYSALRKKTNQLRESGWQGLAGAMICDGDCASLRVSAGQHPSAAEIVHGFFRANNRFSFVVTLRVNHDYKRESGLSYSITPAIYFAAGTSTDTRTRLSTLFTQVAESLPRPVWSPENARNHIQEPDGTHGRKHGWSRIMNDKVKVSSRSFMEWFAGKVSDEAFQRDHAVVRAYVASRLAEGRMIARVDVERLPDEDDDVIVLSFSEPDVAISNFVVPKVRG